MGVGEAMNANESLFQSIRVVNVSQDLTEYEVCLFQPAHTSSLGIWGKYIFAGPPMLSSFPVFMLQIMVIFLTTQACHFLLKRLGFSFLISQMMAGLILGPSLQLDFITEYKKKLFPFGSQEPLATITSIGFSIFIFLTGVQMDFSVITRSGKRSWAIAFTGLAVPLMIGFPSVFFGFSKLLDHATGSHSADIPVVFISHSITSFAVIASLLNELKIINSELGRLALSTALVSDVLSTTVTSMGTAIVDGLHAGNRMLILANLGGTFAFVIFVPLFCRPAMLWIVKNTPEGRPVKDIYTFSIILMVLSLGWVSVKLDQDFILGAFVLGLAVPEGPPLGAALVKKLDLFGTWLLLPVFVTTCMMKADLTVPFTLEYVVTIIAIVTFTHIIKMIVNISIALCCKMPIIDALSLSLIMNCKGVVEVCTYSGLLDRRNIRSQTYSIMMVCTMVIASFVQMSVKLLHDPSRKYAGYQRRNIMGLKQNSELRVLSCIHTHYHITPMTNFLNLCYPTVDKPIIVDALHLIELVGRSLPIFISHRFKDQQNVSGSHNYSDNVILAFNLFEHGNPGAVSVNTYTAISPPALMHEDVCNLALDRLAAIIILPFHRRWSIDGGIESDNKNIRALNCNVMERAPCSVGILVSRGSPQADSSNFRLAVVFLGGKDDREALCLAKRAMRDAQIHLVVYYIIEDGKMRRSSYNSLDYMLDKAVLKEVREAHSSIETVTYREILSEDGPQTASILRAMTEQHDFFMVGRRHDSNSPLLSGLSDWVEFSELGVVGDLLASTDIETRASVLVVQQQELHK